MGRNANHGGSHAVLAVCLTIAAGCSQPEPDPRLFARELARESGAPRQLPAEPAVATFDFGLPAATSAPLGEGRLGLAVARKATVLLGNGAIGIDAELTEALGRQAAELVVVKTTCPDRDAIERMLQGRADFAVIGGKLSARDQHAGLRQAQLGVELWGLGVAESSPLRSLTRAQLRQVLTGEVRDLLGLGQRSGEIRVFVPADADAARRAAKALIPGDPMGRTSTAIADSEFANALREPGAIGVVRVGVTPLPDGGRWLAIDWSPPTAEAFRYGTYPFGFPVTLVTQGQPSGAAAALLTFARSDDGQTLFGRGLLTTP